MSYQWTQDCVYFTSCKCNKWVR